ncbi:MAG: hypothetical protein ACYC91_06450 [Solirubrobacteraceae bacterium]
MKDVHVAVGVIAISLNVAATLYGAWSWYRVRRSTWFWRLMRTAQISLVVQAALGGILVAVGHKVASLHLLYGLLPLAVSFLAEQLRVASAQMVLDARGLENATAVGALPSEEQRDVVMAIVQREIGVMALAALVIVVLLARAAGTAG